MVELMTGDCLEELKKLKDNSVDAVVTDPPAGISFMGKEWDTFDKSMFGKKGEEGKKDLKIEKNFNILPRYGNADLQGFQDFICKVFLEVKRVLKPGGHCLVWAIPRTSHHTAMGLERAGFEIRDIVMHIFGTGFPKSLNVGKSIDKIQGNEREEFETENTRDRTKHNATTILTEQKVTGWKDSKGSSEWEGWGTGLKPGAEHWILCRKPLSEKNVALNVLKWGTGGINIDECRIHNKDNPFEHFRGKVKKAGNFQNGVEKEWTATDSSKGRFPANTIFDEEAGKMLDEQSGVSSSKEQIMGRGFDDSEVFGNGDLNYKLKRGHNDKGGASRFFYCTKPSKKERDRGCEEFEYKKGVDIMASADWQKDRGRNPENYKGNKNDHPTVKSIALMKYLIKLVSKENSIILDPFLGSGTTGIASLELNRKFIGIEQNEEYMKIAKARINSIKFVED